VSVTLTDEQAKNMAASLRNAANVLDPVVTPTPEPTPTPTPTPTPVPPTNYPNFQLIYDEQFTKDCAEGQFLTTYGDRFFVYPNGWKDTSKKGNYNPNMISVNAGVMNMRMRTVNGVPQVCAPEPKINGSTADRNQLYGRYEARFRADATDGYKLAWLLWPKSGVWPRDGEIDFPEGDLIGSIGAFMHRQNGSSGSDQDAYKTTAKFPSWHTAVIEWKPNNCKFILDGNVIGTSTSRVPNTPMHWVLQSETELNSTYPAASAVANV
jgi:beta-glucanase (GH16 family)